MFLKDLLKLPSQRTYTDEGFLNVPASIGRTGIQEYLAVEMGLKDRNPNDIVKVYRPEEEVFKKESLDSFANKPITNNHPPELLNSKNAKKYLVGMSDKEIRRNGDFIETVFHITDEDAIAAIESGKTQLSNGYLADIEWVSGLTPEGLQYDAIQRNIRGNHIAIVDQGRAGSNCKIADEKTKQAEEKTMKVKILGVEYEVTDQVAQAVEKLQSENEKLKDECGTSTKKMEEAKDELEEKEEEMKKTEDALKAQLDDAKSKILSVEDMDKMVEARINLIESAKAVYPEIAWEGKDANTIMREVVAEKCEKVHMDSASKNYVKARFDILVEDAMSGEKSPLSEVFKKQAEVKKVEDSRPLHVIAREKMIEDSRNAWKKKQ